MSPESVRSTILSTVADRIAKISARYAQTIIRVGRQIVRSIWRLYAAVERGIATAGADIVFLLWAIRTLVVLIAIEFMLVYYGGRWKILWGIAAVFAAIMFVAALQDIRERRRETAEAEGEMWPRARPVLIWMFRFVLRSAVALVACYFTLNNVSPRLAHDARFELLTQVTEWHANTARLLRTEQPPIPFADDYPCPYECCNYDEWQVRRETYVRAYPNKSAIVTSLMAVDDVVDASDSVVITRQAGSVRILRRVTLGGVSFDQGETIYPLRPTQQGRQLFWYAGRTYDALLVASPELPVQVLRRPSYEWWVKVKPKDAPVGWALQEGQLERTKQCT